MASVSKSQHTIAGTVLTMPVRVRKADVHSAMFTVDTGAAQRLLDYSGLKVFEIRSGRAVINLLLTRFVENDLGQYNEFSFCVMVQPPGSNVHGLRGFGEAGTFVHRMLVDQGFTLEAGRKIWGYPKIMADFAIRDGNPFGFDVTADGALLVDMTIGRGLPVPMPSRPQSLLTYTNIDGTTRETAAEQVTTGMHARLGGATVRLGDHPYAKELASLGLPKKAFACMSIGNADMTFGDATVVD
ncbi:MAG TPA: acetoacetate decarboxylase family protein [Mycobacterium sp.]|nr:acetoacetate decarboxylase family protein [Mycobacterium sp.]